MQVDLIGYYYFHCLVVPNLCQYVQLFDDVTKRQEKDCCWLLCKIFGYPLPNRKEENS
uniref:Uncharacterized protein n=1 Tax=Meloidogyne enterolobii TaxID=390850 RepID=A0A6V7TY60_MELEN|nr:unnamed protein product [Meloidogyne enterolobii]